MFNLSFAYKTAKTRWSESASKSRKLDAALVYRNSRSESVRAVGERVELEREGPSLLISPDPISQRGLPR